MIANLPDEVDDAEEVEVPVTSHLVEVECLAMVTVEARTADSVATTGARIVPHTLKTIHMGDQTAGPTSSRLIHLTSLTTSRTTSKHMLKLSMINVVGMDRVVVALLRISTIMVTTTTLHIVAAVALPEGGLTTAPIVVRMVKIIIITTEDKAKEGITKEGIIREDMAKEEATVNEVAARADMEEGMVGKVVITRIRTVMVVSKAPGVTTTII